MTREDGKGPVQRNGMDFWRNSLSAFCNSPAEVDRRLYSIVVKNERIIFFPKDRTLQFLQKIYFCL